MGEEPEFHFSESGTAMRVIMERYNRYDDRNSDHGDYYRGSPSTTPEPMIKEQKFDYYLFKDTGTQKNRRKYKLNWKRQNDKKGNIKYKKRSNRRKDISLMIKNEWRQ